jgi:hypothetical protein
MVKVEESKVDSESKRQQCIVYAPVTHSLSDCVQRCLTSIPEAQRPESYVLIGGSPPRPNCEPTGRLPRRGRDRNRVQFHHLRPHRPAKWDNDFYGRRNFLKHMRSYLMVGFDVFEGDLKFLRLQCFNR